jgi:paraquat-inducible protein A
MALSTMGRRASTSIFGGVLEMWLQGEAATAALMAFCAVVAPAVYIGFMLTVLLSVRRSPAPAWVGALLRIAKFNQPWAMVEVMMLGLLVALTKIAALATVIPGIGIFAVGTLIVLMAAVAVSFDPQEVWTRIRWVDSEASQSAEFSASAGLGRTGS